MNILLVAINSKYIHSNLAVYSLDAFAKARGAKTVEIVEYTINQPLEKIRSDIMRRKPDVVFLSCYIWNYKPIKSLIGDIIKIDPNLDVWLGGPEVSYDCEKVLEAMPQVKGIIRGEGERAFAELVFQYEAGKLSPGLIRNLVYRDENSNVQATELTGRMDFDSIDFAYNELEKFDNKIVYYESSRGCPFRCSYCLSSVDKELSFRSLDIVERELQFFLDKKVPQVKFIDRTFNCNRKRATALWQYMKDNDNGVTNFHFEIAADILTDDDVKLLSKVRPGQFQLEIGVQTTCPETISEINRPMDFDKVKKVVSKILEFGNIHVHLDLIAGLPFETMERFKRSFDEVFDIGAHQLQLGFLKVLKGSPMAEKAAEYELVYSDEPPYEVLKTNWISYDELMVLKGVDEMVDAYYNSGQFPRTMELIIRDMDAGAFAMFEALAKWHEEHDLDMIRLSRDRRYEILMDFGREVLEESLHEQLKQAIIFDYYSKDPGQNRPAFMGPETADRDYLKKFYKYESLNHSILNSPGLKTDDIRQLRHRTHFEVFDGKWYLFDYSERNPVTKLSKVKEVKKLKL